MPLKNKQDMSKSKSKELDVDFIGGQGPLTKEEEQKISEYLRSQKLLRAKRSRLRGTTRGLYNEKKLSLDFNGTASLRE